MWPSLVNPETPEGGVVIQRNNMVRVQFSLFWILEWKISIVEYLPKGSPKLSEVEGWTLETRKRQSVDIEILLLVYEIRRY